MTTTRFALVFVALIVTKDTAVSETVPLTCPAGAGLETLDGERGRIEFCAKGETLHGPAREWYANGTHPSVTHYAAGVKAGPIAEWDEEGEQISAGQFEHGKARGTWTFRKPVTRVTFKVVYENGEALSSAPIAAGEFKEWVDQPSTPCGGV